MTIGPPGGSRQSGFNLIELLMSLALGSLILVGFSGMLLNGLDAKASVEERLQLTRAAHYAMGRMVRSARDTHKLLLPIGDNPSTNWPENVRSQTNPATPPIGDSSLATAVMAVALPASWDSDHDGVADADNDADGRIDEDMPADTQNDGKAGLRDFDDDGNGIKDFWFSPAGDDDESNNLAQSEDTINGIDDDGDGSIDEDPSADNNGDGAPGVAGFDDDGDGNIDEGDTDDDDEDGLVDEDWLDPLVYYLQGTNLIERRTVPWDTSGDNVATGRDFVESVIAENVTLLEFECLLPATGEHQRIVISLTLTDAEGESVSLSTTVRVGRGDSS